MVGERGSRPSMRYRVHQLKVHQDTAREELERFVNDLEGAVVSVVPFVVPVFMPFGGAARTRYLLVVEQLGGAAERA
jgi:hypothetical protein